MKKLICILASAALFGACEQKTVTPAAAPADKKTENNTTIVNPPAKDTGAKTTTNVNTAPAANSDVKTETKTETTTATSPNP